MFRKLVAIVPAVPLVAFAAALDAPSFQPEAGTVLSKTFTSSVLFELDDLSLVAQDMDMTEMLGAFEITVETEQTITVTDEYVEMDGGRLRQLKRTFDTLASSAVISMSNEMMGDENKESTSESDLEGRTVVFTWDDEEDDYVVTFDGDEEDDEDLLESLTEDMDLRVLLPEDDVSEGDQWEIDPVELGSIFMPGGNLHLVPPDVDEEQMEFFEGLFGDELKDMLEEALEGTVTCTYKGKRNDGGVEVGTIEIEIEISLLIDLSDFITDLIDELAEGEMPDFSLDMADLGFEYEGKALLLWNLEEGHVHLFESSGDVSITFDIQASAEGQSIELSAEASGVMEIGVETS